MLMRSTVPGKRNTSRAVFTSYERAVAKASWSASSARLTRESFLPFASCVLCLEPARDPVACALGDIFCRECALSNILAQKKEIKRLDKAAEQEGRDVVELQARQNAEAQERAVQEFELVQAGFDVRNGETRRVKAGTQEKEEEEVLAAPEDANRPRRGEKRKFELDEDELRRIATSDRAKARRAIDDEEAAKPTLPSFWTPSVTPSSNKNDVLHEVKKKTKSAPTCPASQEDRPHHYALHTLVTVHFTEEADPKAKDPQRICPSCKRGLSNASKAMLAKPCGHVTCKSCVDKFMKPSFDPHAPGSDAVRCYVCDSDLTERKAERNGRADKERIRPGLVELKSEGPGFSAAGATEVQRNIVSFKA